ncbi:hypothetical protein [Hymenobacter chitinivorans]|uniref:Uncharacterized protein n=1 Tax=Hymenobacter chitinivorans DSM 11115 TaxID=1121954 RepID=A0A2M9BN73_9BACT|nr:hypothetical protein [Hymenobacter chitinivorans]PJJ59360.1 hypothetical protein CLV45_0777 [Hymenobacter chitinivorans DSM 11115]
MVKAKRTPGITDYVKNGFRAHHVLAHKAWVDNQKFFDDSGLGKKSGRKGKTQRCRRIKQPLTPYLVSWWILTARNGFGMGAIMQMIEKTGMAS